MGRRFITPAQHYHYKESLPEQIVMVFRKDETVDNISLRHFYAFDTTRTWVIEKAEQVIAASPSSTIEAAFKKARLSGFLRNYYRRGDEQFPIIPAMHSWQQTTNSQWQQKRKKFVYRGMGCNGPLNGYGQPTESYVSFGADGSILRAIWNEQDPGEQDRVYLDVNVQKSHSKIKLTDPADRLGTGYTYFEMIVNPDLSIQHAYRPNEGTLPDHVMQSLNDNWKAGTDRAKKLLEDFQCTAGVIGHVFGFGTSKPETINKVPRF